MRTHLSGPEGVLTGKQGDYAPGRIGKRPAVVERIRRISQENRQIVKMFRWMYSHLDQMLHPSDILNDRYMNEVFGAENLAKIQRAGG